MLDHSVIGIIAGILAFAAIPRYIWSVMKGRTRPDRVTWWILAFLNGLIFATSYALGAWDTLWLPLGYALGYGFIGIFSLRYGEGNYFLTRLQKTCVFGALISAAIWWFSGSALLALVFTIVIDFLGIIPTMHKAYLRPWHEDKLAWGIALIASVLYILAVDSWDVAIGAYPVYVLVTNTILAFLIIPSRRTHML